MPCGISSGGIAASGVSVPEAHATRAERRSASDLAMRLAVAVIGVPLCALVVFLGGTVFAVGLGLLAAVAYREFAQLHTTAPRPFVALGAAGAGLFPLVVLYGGPSAAWLLATGLLMTFGAYGMARVPVSEKPVGAAGLTAFGALYIGGLLSLGVPLREGSIVSAMAIGDPERLAATAFFFYPVVVTWLADTAAYFVGRALGRRRLAPVVSPNKTVEGAIAALVAGPVSALAYAVVLPGSWRLGAGTAIAFGLVVAGFAIIGDLVESALKRERAVKDSSNLLPGHGGLLDRLDSLLWALPAAYFFFAALLKWS